MQGDLVSRAVAAATSLARALDLEVDDAIVIQNSNTLALRLLPCDVFARTALLGQEVAAFQVPKLMSDGDSTVPKSFGTP